MTDCHLPKAAGIYLLTCCPRNCTVFPLQGLIDKKEGQELLCEKSMKGRAVGVTHVSDDFDESSPFCCLPARGPGLPARPGHQNTISQFS